jgi:hypothetical protein
MKYIKCLAAVAIFSALAGCAIQPAVKDVLVNPSAHLETNFSEAKLSESVRKKLRIQNPGTVKRQVQVETTMTNIDGETKQSFQKNVTFYVLDNGLVRSMVQTGNNGILSLTEFDLTYYDIFSLIHQTISHSATTAYMPIYAKTISKLDKGIANPKESTEYTFEYALATEVQIANFADQKTVCKTGKWFAAKTLHSKLTGMALPIDCEYFGRNGQTFLKMESAFIKDLGITLKRESASSTRKRTWVINDVK